MSQPTQEAVETANAQQAQSAGTASTDQTATQATETEAAGTSTATAQSTETEDGRGSKDAILADLATERDRRQAAEKQNQAVLKAIQEALGIKTETVQSPEDLQTALTESQAETTSAKLQLAIYRSPAGKEADVDALLDSRAFQETVSKVDPSDPAAVEQAIKTFVEKNPRFKAAAAGETPTVPAARDLTQGNGQKPSGKSMDDLLRGK